MVCLAQPWPPCLPCSCLDLPEPRSQEAMTETEEKEFDKMDETTELVWKKLSKILSPTQREKDAWPYHKFKAFGLIEQGIGKNDWKMLDEGVKNLEIALERLNAINNVELASDAEDAKERADAKKKIE